MERHSLAGDLRVLWHLVARPVRGTTHAERLEHFYCGQAHRYDDFRSRLLHGRQRLMEATKFPAGGIWVDLGAGTGENVVLAAERARSLAAIHLVDLSPSLLRVASERLSTLPLDSIQMHVHDATVSPFAPSSVDVVTMSYSLTMIPDWFEAIAAAETMLKPGGVLGVTDFYVSRKYACDGHRQHGWMRRAFWTHWFAMDNVHLNGDHIAMLHRRFEVRTFEEAVGRVPYMPLLRAPYYVFVGRKPSS
jgi:S-adenosylmethionine-diacylgycerolhomoserine-N-methlytransferase